MKLLTALFLVIGLHAAAQSQVPATAVAPEDAAFNTSYANRSVPKVTGKLLNLTPAELKSLTITYTLVTPFAEFQVQKTASAQPDGSFSLQLDYALPYQQIWFGVGDFFWAGLYADKGLYVELDMKKIKAVKDGVSWNGEGVRYLGADGPLNVYLNNYVLYRRPEQLELSSKINALIFTSRAPADSILPSYNKLNDSLKLIQDDYIAANPSTYSWMLDNERMSDYYGYLCIKYFGKKMDDALWQKMKQHKSYLTTNSSADYYNYVSDYVEYLPGGYVQTIWKDVALLPDLDIAEKAVIDSLKESEKAQPAYPCTTEDIKRWQAVLKLRMQKIALVRQVNKNIERIDSAFSTAKADFLKLRLGSSKDVSDQQDEWQRILNSMHTPWCKAVAKTEYVHTAKKVADINKTLAKYAGGTQHNSFGKPLIETDFGASLYKAPSIKALDFLAKLKQNFPNKAIIIDRWATWCGPCLGEMPHSKELQAEGKDLPVVFVYLCTLHESSEDKWKRKVIELKQPGIHILIDEALDADLSKYFSFNGYPGYAFIDKSGTYKPGAITWMSEIKDGDALAAMVNK